MNTSPNPVVAPDVSERSPPEIDMSDAPHPDGPEPSDADSLHKDLPFGMAGLTVMLERLREGVEGRERADDEAWSASRCRLVAEYILSLASEYWMSGDELAYCRRVVAA